MRTALVALALVIALVLAFRWFTGGGERATPDEVASAAASGDATFLDVRRPGEFASGHVAGARNADVLDASFQGRVADLDRDRTVYVYCASGVRSGRAARILNDMGFAHVVNAGGVGDLDRAGVAMER